MNSSIAANTVSDNVKDDAFWPVMIAIFFGAFVSVLNTSTINIAIPSLVVDFQSTIQTIQWTLTGFILATGLSAPLAGFLGDKFGNRNLYIYSLIGFGIASILCAIAWNPLSLIIFRIVQGFFCGVIMPTTMTIIYQTFASHHHAFAMSLWSLAAWMAPALGPVTAGFILQFWSWQWLFLINLPLTIVAIILAVKLIPQKKVVTKEKLDIRGLVMVLYCSFALLIAFSEAGNWGWASWQVWLFLLTGIIVLALFIVWQLHIKEPLLNLRVFKEPHFMLSIIINGALTASLFAGIYMVPIFMQTVQGASPIEAGLVLLPAAAIMIFVMPAVGKIYNRVGAFWLVVIGMMVIAYSQWQLNLLTIDTSSSYILLWMAVRNVGMALASAPATNAGMEVISTKLYGHGSAVNNWTRQVISAFAIGLFTTLYATRQAHHLDVLTEKGMVNNLEAFAMTKGINDVFFASTMIIIISLPLAFGLRRKERVIIS